MHGAFSLSRLIVAATAVRYAASSAASISSKWQNGAVSQRWIAKINASTTPFRESCSRWSSGRCGRRCRDWTGSRARKRVSGLALAHAQNSVTVLIPRRCTSAWHSTNEVRLASVTGPVLPKVVPGGPAVAAVDGVGTVRDPRAWSACRGWPWPTRRTLARS